MTQVSIKRVKFASQMEPDLYEGLKLLPSRMAARFRQFWKMLFVHTLKTAEALQRVGMFLMPLKSA